MRQSIFRIVVVLLVCTLAPVTAIAQPAAETVQWSPSSGLSLIDWLIILAYALGTIALGWYYSRRQNSTDEYFVGSGSMNPILIGVSLFATLLSTVSYLSMPGESLGKGPVNMTSMLILPVVFLIVSFWLLPVYMKHRVTSAYELLEERLGLSVRLLGAAMFVALRLVWMSLLIYLTAAALAIMMGLDETYIPLVALVTGFVAVIYTSLGGLCAVVITDFVQTVLLYGGALLVLGTISWDLGGFDWMPLKWDPSWDTQPIFSTDLSVRVTVVGTLLNYVVWYVCTAGGDQTSVQRFMATKDAGALRWAFATQLFVTVIVGITLGLLGFALLGYFNAHPERLPADISLNQDADKIFPHFIAFHLPVGISGLVVAAMLAAAMSSIDSGVNSITAVVMTDGLDRFGLRPKSDRSHVRIARCLAFAIGAVVVLGSSAMGQVPGNITAVTTKTSNLLTTPIFALFFFALFVPFASPRGVWIGAICGTTTAVLIAFSGPIFGYVPGTKDLNPISFQWIAPVAIMVNIATGCIGSLLLPKKSIQFERTA